MEGGELRKEVRRCVEFDDELIELLALATRLSEPDASHPASVAR